MLLDTPACRLVAFTLGGGQVVPVHTSRSAVIVTVVEGEGTFTGGDGESGLAAGDSASYAPDEPHGMKAGPDGLRFLAVITPSPSAGGQ
jgi:quercetin dioxygenase-like cupin family protein